MSKPVFTTWEEVAEKIETETIFDHKDAELLVSFFRSAGAPVGVYGERLCELVGKSWNFMMADMLMFCLYDEFMGG